MRLLQTLSRAVSGLTDPLAEQKPEIEWVKWVETPSLAAFVREINPRATATIEKVQSVSGQFFIKTAEGTIYKRYGDDPSAKWRDITSEDPTGFRSGYLESVMDNAMERGLRKQPSAYEISQMMIGPGTRRTEIIWSGTDEEFARIDIDYPTPPIGFDDIHVPSDFAESHPNFKAYLERHGYGPFWFQTGYDTPKDEAEAAEELIPDLSRTSG